MILSISLAAIQALLVGGWRPAVGSCSRCVILVYSFIVDCWSLGYLCRTRLKSLQTKLNIGLKLVVGLRPHVLPLIGARQKYLQNLVFSVFSQTGMKNENHIPY